MSDIITMTNELSKMIELKLTKDQAEYLEAALEKALDNENNDAYSCAYTELLELLENVMR